MEKKPALFLDRDGVINHNVFYPDTQEWESPRSPDDLKLIEGSVEALKAFGEKYHLFIVTNQPSFAKGKTTLENLKGVHQKLLEVFTQEGILLVKAYYCFHHPQYGAPCHCRKPSPFFLEEAFRAYPIDKEGTYMIGDRDSDYQCALKGGLSFIGIRSDDPNPEKCRQILSNDQIPVFSSLKEIVL